MHHPIRPSACRRQRRQWLVAVWLLVITIGWQVSGSDVGRADDKVGVDDPQSRQQASEALTSKLPTPPEAIAKLIADGKVVFDFYDDKQYDFAFAGETTFDFRYEYRCRTRYHIIDQPARDSADESEAQSGNGPTSESGSGQALEVMLDYEEVTLKLSHRMRLPSRLVGEDFFDQPLVKHEFDHVAISADPRLPSLLIKMLADRNSKLIIPLSIEESESRDRAKYAEIARTAAKVETAKVFEDFMSLIRIRYKELDQVTRHGREPLAPETRLRLLNY